MSKCKYCKASFPEKEWHTEEEKEMCFSCRCIEGVVKGMGISISLMGMYGKKSKDYWSGKLKSIL